MSFLYYQLIDSFALLTIDLHVNIARNQVD